MIEQEVRERAKEICTAAPVRVGIPCPDNIPGCLVFHFRQDHPNCCPECARIADALLEFRKEALEEIKKAFPSPRLFAVGADALAFKLENGKDIGAISREDLAAWLRDKAIKLHALARAIQELEE